jgi:hypothetical protein
MSNENLRLILNSNLLPIMQKNKNEPYLFFGYNTILYLFLFIFIYFYLINIYIYILNIFLIILHIL